MKILGKCTAFLLGIFVCLPYCTLRAEGGELDFLEKMENIQIPTQEKPNQETKKPASSGKPSTSLKTPLGSSNPKTSHLSKTKTQTAKSPTTIPTTPTHAPTSTKPIQTTKEGSPESNLEKESAYLVNETKELWMDESLEMEPTYLAGMVDAKPEEKPILAEVEKAEPIEKPIVPSPGPSLVSETPSLPTWEKVLNFLDRYQKAFYILGILLLFAIYRLKSGRTSSSSKKSVTTIRKIRR